MLTPGKHSSYQCLFSSLLRDSQISLITFRTSFRIIKLFLHSSSLSVTEQCTRQDSSINWVRDKLSCVCEDSGQNGWMPRSTYVSNQLIYCDYILRRKMKRWREGRKCSYRASPVEVSLNNVTFGGAFLFSSSPSYSPWMMTWICGSGSTYVWKWKP